MSPLGALLRHLQSQRELVNRQSLFALLQFIRLGTIIKNDIILSQPAMAPIDMAPSQLSPAFQLFLQAGCSITSTEVDYAWVLLKDVIWKGGLESMLGNDETI
jgi:hypothetical protein